VSFNLSYLPPSRDLIDIVSAFYLFESDEPELRELERADVAQFRFTLAGSGSVLMPNGTAQLIHPVSIFGPRMAASTVAAKGPTKVFGCGLRPGGWAAIVGQDASEFSDQITDATALIPNYTTPLLPQIVKATDFAAMVAAFENHFRAQAYDLRAIPFWFLRHVDDWLQSELNPSMDDLIALTGLGRRKIEGMLKTYYGAAPKLLIRKYRALRTASQIANGDGDWQDYAAEVYYDQSHCIRDVKEFVGITPAAVKGQRGRLMNLVFGRRDLEGMISPLSAQT
jgi:AraC-like DNA-binding protein